MTARLDSLVILFILCLVSAALYQWVRYLAMQTMHPAKRKALTLSLVAALLIVMYVAQMLLNG